MPKLVSKYGQSLKIFIFGMNSNSQKSSQLSLKSLKSYKWGPFHLHLGLFEQVNVYNILFVILLIQICDFVVRYHFFGNWSHHYGFYCFWCTFVLIRARVVFSISYWFTGTVLKTVTYPVLLTGLGLFTDFGAALPLNSNLIEVWTKFWFVVFIYSKSQTSKRKRKVL